MPARRGFPLASSSLSFLSSPSSRLLINDYVRTIFILSSWTTTVFAVSCCCCTAGFAYGGFFLSFFSLFSFFSFFLLLHKHTLFTRPVVDDTVRIITSVSTTIALAAVPPPPHYHLAQSIIEFRHKNPSVHRPLFPVNEVVSGWFRSVQAFSFCVPRQNTSERKTINSPDNGWWW